MSVLGLTIDYGPYAWMEHFEPDFICNHSDREHGRYRYVSQPEICKWNLLKLCEALDPLIPLGYSSSYVEEYYSTMYEALYQSKMAEKLGFIVTKPP